MRAFMRSRNAAYCVLRSMNGVSGFVSGFIDRSRRTAFAVVRLDPLTIRAARYRLHPVHVRQVPLDGRAQPALEALARLPAELLSYLARVYGVAAVVSGPVFHERDELRVRRALGPQL